MMKNTMLRCLCGLMTVLLLTGCEKALVDGEDVSLDGNVILNLSIYDQIPFSTRSVQDIALLSSRVNVAFFQDGTKVKTVSQKADDASFGKVGLTLAEGVYQVVVIAHNSSGSATITSPEKVTFPSNVVTETFYYEGELTVTSAQQTYELQLRRAVSMFRLELTDELPAEAAKIRFYYTGGSSTFSPATGYGCVNSRQTVMIQIEDGQQVFEIYTFPHEDNDVLKITVTVYDINENILKETVLEGVPVTLDKITVYTTSLWGGGGGTSSSAGISMTAESDWAGTITYP